MKTQYPPGPRSRIPGDMLFRFRKNPIAFLMDAARYGDIVYFKIGMEPFYFLNHPDYVKEVLVTRESEFLKGKGLQVTRSLLGEGLLTSEGDFHLRQRRLLQPSFHRKQVARYASIMIAYGERIQQPWRDGAVVDISEAMMRLTLGIVAKALFDADVEGDAADIGRSLGIMRERFDFLLFPLANLLTPFPLPFNRRAREAQACLDRVIFRLIDERRGNGKETGDLLSVLLGLRDETGTGMSDQQVRDEAMTLFLAGHETTANALTWTWYLLSQHPDVEEKFHTEIDTVCDGRPLSVEDYSRLSYTKKIFTESLRLYPPAWFIVRQPVHDTRIGGFVIPRGATVALSPYCLHHDPRYFPDPEQFDPDRWNPEMEASLPRYAFFPFGGGQRLCIGEPMAWMEGILLLAVIGRNWRMTHRPRHRVALDPKITLRAKYGMEMILKVRKTSA